MFLESSAVILLDTLQGDRIRQTVNEEETLSPVEVE